MAMQTEPRRTGEHVVSEANGQRSREQVMLLSGNLPAGAVVSMSTPGEYEPVALEDITAPADGTTDTGEPASLAVLYGPTDASDSPAPCVIHKRDCEVSVELLGWPEGATDEQIAIGLNLLESAGLIAR